MKLLRAIGYLLAYFVLLFLGILLGFSLISSFNLFFLVLSTLSLVAGSTMIYGLQMDRPDFLWPMVGFFAYFINYNIMYMFDGVNIVNTVFALIWFGFMLIPVMLIRQMKAENQRNND